MTNMAETMGEIKHQVLDSLHKWADEQAVEPDPRQAWAKERYFRAVARRLLGRNDEIQLRPRQGGR